jgi:hypothetical protein
MSAFRQCSLSRSVKINNGARVDRRHAVAAGSQLQFAVASGLFDAGRCPHIAYVKFLTVGPVTDIPSSMRR